MTSHLQFVERARSWLQHAFAAPTHPNELPPEQQAVMERLCQEIARRKLGPAAIAFLEMSRPMNYLGAQALHFFSPLISAVAQGTDHEHLAGFLERRDAIDRLCRRIDELEASARG